MPADLAVHQQLTQRVLQILKTSAAPGASLALTLNGKPFYVSACGFSDLKRTRALETRDRFYIYSVTKTLIAVTILRLAEQSRLDLDQPAQTYLPDLPLETLVSLRQLLNHTAGIPDYGGMPAYFDNLKAHPTLPWSSEQFLERVLAQGLAFAPGQGWAYSNTGFLILRRVIETVRQSPLAEALHEQIFSGLNLRYTSTAQSLADARQLTPGYSAFFAADGALQDIRDLYHPGWVSHGLVISNALELARIFDAIFGGQLIRPDSLQAMQTAVNVPFSHLYFQKPAYGLGLMVDLGSPHGLVAGHGGGGPGYSAGALHFPNLRGRKLISVALVNSDQGDLGLQLAFTLAMAAVELLEP